MTDGVARELEQAEARMADARDEAHMAFGGQASLSALTDAAIEVGRLRALAEQNVALSEAYAVVNLLTNKPYEPTNGDLSDSDDSERFERWVTEQWTPLAEVYTRVAALAAREEAQP